MKQIYIQNTVQNPKEIVDVLLVNFQTNQKLKVSQTVVPNLTKPPYRPDNNEWTVEKICKGPPGRSRSPGVGHGLFPDHPPDGEEDRNASPLSFGREGSGVSQKRIQFINTEQTFYNTQKLNFYLQLNFTNMKKQILILVLFVLAAFAGINRSYGQDLDYIPINPEYPIPTTLPCATDDALHPLVGKTYTYSVTVAPNTSDYIQWFVYNATTATSVITAGALASAAAELNTGVSPYLMSTTGAVYNSTTNTTASIDVKWQSFDGAANKILLVAYVKGASGCSDNIEVYRIQPSFAFSLDIAGLMPTGKLPASGNAVECLSPVQRAAYDAAADRLTMDYGENYIFFAVTAANFVHSWTPTFTVVSSTLTTQPAVSDITWAYPAEAVKTTSGIWNAAATPIEAQSPALGSIGGAGEFIIVRVHLDHGADENDAATPTRNVVIGVDGIMYNVATSNYSNTALQDVDPSAAGSPCTQTVTDQATYDLTSRPEITSTTPTGPEPFIQKN